MAYLWKHKTNNKKREKCSYYNIIFKVNKMTVILPNILSKVAISDARTKQADKDLQKQKQKQNPVHIKKDPYIPWS